MEKIISHINTALGILQYNFVKIPGRVEKIVGEHALVQDGLTSSRYDHRNEHKLERLFQELLDARNTSICLVYFQSHLGSV